MADGVGFEPTEGFHLRRFSRPVLSTAQSIPSYRLLASNIFYKFWNKINLLS
jgi:hypothetical protein